MATLGRFIKNISDLGHKRVRKNPRIHPKAKTKLFNVKEPGQQDPVELELCNKWWSDYRLQYEAAIQQELMKTDSVSEQIRRQELISQWNKETRQMASSKLQELLNKRIKDEYERRMEFEDKEKIRSNQLFENLAFLNGCDLITEENLDEKVDEILNSNVIDYNFCVGRRGQITKGSGLNVDEDSDAADTNESDSMSVTV